MPITNHKRRGSYHKNPLLISKKNTSQYIFYYDRCTHHESKLENTLVTYMSQKLRYKCSRHLNTNAKFNYKKILTELLNYSNQIINHKDKNVEKF